MNKEKRKAADEIISRLRREYRGAKIPLEFSSPWELLVAVILSAQCTDERVNKVTRELFKKYRGVKDFARANITELEKVVYSTGFYRAKSRNIVGAAKSVIENFDGKVPRTMDEILTLPGVARKTANVVLAHAYGVVEGIAVDTHVRRLAGRLGLSSEEDPVKIERDLMAIVGRDGWRDVSLLLQYHGRAFCRAAKPDCAGCVLSDICPSAFAADLKHRRKIKK
ncbi:MAG: endonuclease III [Endomicrobiia bacterium]|nr:endonuclease III [Endomicrobiia bacterium]